MFATHFDGAMVLKRGARLARPSRCEPAFDREDWSAANPRWVGATKSAGASVFFVQPNLDGIGGAVVEFNPPAIGQPHGPDFAILPTRPDGHMAAER